jgi:hypothetical protein
MTNFNLGTLAAVIICGAVLYVVLKNEAVKQREALRGIAIAILMTFMMVGAFLLMQGGSTPAPTIMGANAPIFLDNNSNVSLSIGNCLGINGANQLYVTCGTEGSSYTFNSPLSANVANVVSLTFNSPTFFIDGNGALSANTNTLQNILATPFTVIFATTSANQLLGGNQVYVMGGLGNTMTITPTTSGTVEFTVTGTAQPSSASIPPVGWIRLAYGTGTAPGKGASVTGTVFDAPLESYQTSVANWVPFSQTSTVNGLAIGTSYWFDIQLKCTDSTLCSMTVKNVTATLQEISN